MENLQQAINAEKERVITDQKILEIKQLVDRNKDFDEEKANDLDNLLSLMEENFQELFSFCHEADNDLLINCCRKVSTLISIIKKDLNYAKMYDFVEALYYARLYGEQLGRQIENKEAEKPNSRPTSCV